MNRTRLRITVSVHAGAITVALLAVALPAAAMAAVPRNIPAQPAKTGSMYNGNNTAPGSLKLHGALAPATLALERTQTAPPANAAHATRQSNANLGGNSSSGRAGGGN